MPLPQGLRPLCVAAAVVMTASPTAIAEEATFEAVRTVSLAHPDALHALPMETPTPAGSESPRASGRRGRSMSFGVSMAFGPQGPATSLAVTVNGLSLFGIATDGTWRPSAAGVLPRIHAALQTIKGPDDVIPTLLAMRPAKIRVF